jgi:dTMP kinase
MIENKSPPFFITFEGGEGVGKSTQVNRLSKFLSERSIDHIVTREPGGSKSAEIIRDLLVNGEPDQWDSETELLLHFAARRDHLARKITPALDDGLWVLCDRFVDSTYAYQGYGHGISPNLIDNMYKFVADEVFPDLTFILDLNPEEGIQRTKKRSLSNKEVLSEDRYERMEIEFHKRIRKGFKEIALTNRERCVLVDASLGEQEIYNNIVSIVIARCLEITA